MFGIAGSSANDIVITGYLDGTTDFGSSTLTTDWDAYIASFGLKTSLQEPLQTQDEITVYPNPFHSNTNLKLPSEPQSAFSLQIFDMLGTKIKEINNISGSVYSLQRDNLTKGLYMYVLINKNGQICGTGKLIAD